MKPNYSTIIFDCDGVLIDSNQLKTDAFRQILSTYPPTVVDDFISYHQHHGGISRYVKLRTFLEKFADEAYAEKQLTELLNNFGKACVALYETADLTPGAIAVLENLKTNTDLYVASGSDQSELRQVFKKKRIDHLFKGIYGSPKTKNELVSEIILKADTAGEVLFIGDAESDWKAAKKHNIDFIFMAQFSDALSLMKTKAEVEGFSTIQNLKELDSLLASVCAQD